MLDIKLVREQPDLVKSSIAARHLDLGAQDVDRLLTIDSDWRDAQGQVDQARSRHKESSATIRSLKGSQRDEAIAEVKALKRDLLLNEERLASLRDAREILLRRMPNILGPDVPQGATDQENRKVRHYGTPESFEFQTRDHLELGTLTDTIDFERGAKVSGNGFYYLKREAAILEHALINFAMARLVPQGFIPLVTPDLARSAILEGIGFAPRGEETQVYRLDDSELCLIGTAEIPLGGYHSTEIIDAAALPLRYVGYSHCFRTEAGAHGRESRGLYRVHQFTKVEMFVICEPETSQEIHLQLLNCEEELLQALEIPYRVVNVCAGDLGGPAAAKYDIEAWMPGRDTYGEVTSCSNCLDYQARRLGVRYRPQGGNALRYVHMLNGTAIATSRTLLAIYENYQREDGSIAIPEVLRPWTLGLKDIPRRNVTS